VCSHMTNFISSIKKYPEIDIEEKKFLDAELKFCCDVIIIYILVIN